MIAMESIGIVSGTKAVETQGRGTVLATNGSGTNKAKAVSHRRAFYLPSRVLLQPKAADRKVDHQVCQRGQ